MMHRFQLKGRPEVPMQTLHIGVVGGLNYSDPSGVLVQRAFQMTRGGLEQKSPMEWVGGHNMDFSRQLMRMRYGSTSYKDLTSILQSGETLLAGCLFAGNVAGGTQFAEVVVGTKSIYINNYTAYATGTFAQAKRPTGAVYLHNATVAKASFVPIDGHLMIMLDGANSIQTLRDASGVTLDDQLGGSYTSGVLTNTTVNADSNSGQKVLNVASTSFIHVGDRIRINSGGARDEAGYVVSLVSNTSVTLFTNLTNSHTAVQADKVTVENRYTQSFGGAQQVLTGSWSQGYFLGMSMQGRFVISLGDVSAEYSAATNPWDRFNGGVVAADGPIVAMEAFTPRFANLLGAVGVFHTLADNAALQYLSGFDPSDTMKTIAGASSPINYQSVCMTMNWIMYPTRNRRWEATDLSRVIDVGRRLKGQDSDSSGPLDTMNLTGAIATGFSFYDARKRQAQFYFPEGANTVNTTAMVLDMQLGEPASFDNVFTDTGGYQFEASLRMLQWNLNNESGVAWFGQIYQRLGNVVGILTTGPLHTTEQPNNAYDIDTYPVHFHVKSPDFTMGIPGIQKKWRRLAVRSLTTGLGNANVDIYLDRENTATAQLTWAFGQVPTGIATLGSLSTSFTLGSSLLGGGGMNTGHSWLEAVSETMAFDITIGNPRPPGFILSTVDVMYQVANLQD